MSILFQIISDGDIVQKVFNGSTLTTTHYVSHRQYEPIEYSPKANTLTNQDIMLDLTQKEIDNTIFIVSSKVWYNSTNLFLDENRLYTIKDVIEKIIEMKVKL